MTGRLGPHEGREVELLLACEKPAALLEVKSPEDAAVLDFPRAAGCIIAEAYIAKAKPTPPNQLRLEVGADEQLRGWPRHFRIARGIAEMDALVNALKYGTCADRGRALGYTDDDIAEFYRVVYSVEWSPRRGEGRGAAGGNVQPGPARSG